MGRHNFVATAVGPVVEMGVETVAGMGAGMVAGPGLFIVFVIDIVFCEIKKKSRLL